MTVRVFIGGLTLDGSGEPRFGLSLVSRAALAAVGRYPQHTELVFGGDLVDLFRSSQGEPDAQLVDDVADCDVVVAAHDFEPINEPQKVARLAKDAGKPCLFIGSDERLPPTELEHGVVYRYSIFKQRPHERTLPVPIVDPIEDLGLPDVEVLPKEATPRVGFCGYIGNRRSRAGMRLGGLVVRGLRQKVDGLDVRASATSHLRRHPGVETRFLLREKYLGAATLAAFDEKHALAEQRREYLQNLLDCPYNLCLRGKGNHSVRLYEVLAAGRIPLFLNTRCVLPFEKEIDWRQLMVWVEDHDRPQIGDALVRFHEQITDEAFRDRQRQCRELWEQRLRPLPFFRHVLRMLASGRPAP